jgi:hypothetical protein
MVLSTASALTGSADTSTWYVDDDYLYFGFDQNADSIHEDGSEDIALSSINEYSDRHWNVDTWVDDKLVSGKMASVSTI